MNDDNLVSIRFADLTAFNEACQELQQGVAQVKHSATILRDILQRAEASVQRPAVTPMSNKYRSNGRARAQCLRHLF